MANFGDPELALQAREAYRSIALDILQKEHPKSRMATVVAIYKDQRMADVTFTGETNVVQVPYTAIAPARVGQFVWVGGGVHDRHIEDVVGESDVEARMFFAESRINSLLDKVVPGWDETALDDLPTSVDQFFQGINDSIGAVDTKATDAVATAGQANTTAGTANSNATTAAQDAAAAQSKAIAAQGTATVADNTANTAISIIQTRDQANNTVSGGMNKLLTFTDGALSTTDWSASSLLLASSNQMVLSGSAGANSYHLARANYVFATDTQAVFAQLGDNQNNDQPTVLILRASADGTTGVALFVTANVMRIGSITFPGNGSTSLGFTAFASQGMTIQSGNTVELRAVGDSFVAFLNGNAVLSYTGAIGSTGSGYRNASAIKMKAVGAFGVTFYSFNLRSFGMYDYGAAGAAATNRRGARLSRLSASPVDFSVGNGSASQMPQNFFSNIDFATDVTVSDLNNGEFTINKSAVYEILADFGVRYAAGEGSHWGECWYGVWLNGTLVIPGALGGSITKREFAAGDKIKIGPVNKQWQVYERGNSADSKYGIGIATAINQLGGGLKGFFQIYEDVKV